jgi:hypothetical protein
MLGAAGHAHQLAIGFLQSPKSLGSGSMALLNAKLLLPVPADFFLSE